MFPLRFGVRREKRICATLKQTERSRKITRMIQDSKKNVKIYAYFCELHLRKCVLIYNSTDDFTFCDYFKTQGSASDTTE